MGRYRKKPVEIEAVRNRSTADSRDAIMRFTEGAGVVCRETASGNFIFEIPTLEGTMVASEGDWIIRGVKGEFYPCKPDIFEATYDLVEDGE